MHDMEVWQHFLEEDVIPQRNAQIRALHHYYVKNKALIAAEFTALFDRFCQAVLARQQEGILQKCAYIHISLLRTSLNEGHPVYMLEASDRETDGKVGLTPFRYEAGWIYGFAEAWDQGCEERRKRYMNRIERHSFEVWMKEQLYPFHVYMVHAARYAMDAIRELASFQEIEKDDSFEVRVGEYRDQEVSESVYCVKERQRTSITCKGWLENKLDQDYIYEHIAGVNLMRGEYEGIDVNYTRFEEVTLTGSTLASSRMLGTRFERCVCDQADFQDCLLYDADFRHCDLTYARFDGVLGNRDFVAEAHGLVFGMNGVQFQGADLTYASFRGAKIAADFTGAELLEVDFTGADLTGSRMLERDALRVELTEEQRQMISWVKEPVHEHA
ncbi:Pentapeptide repeat-containing protein [Paenibacillus algorifonticola]|uniref:Pentapeptide repeat-containing protein n=3 Tax=Paenibacillus algorifonticola TaxID=684063 RepID=A0A1I2IZX9_9BACL|nr:pentapeptide repeat-containing protein [Paenibacillus algorifonticola]SFF47749.1 Pentapeptide repeat-containing protein [Paenibacillus algorifonticola]